MTRLHRLAIALVALTGVSLFIGFRPADDTFISRLLARMDAYIHTFPVEKVYVHTDRAQYLPGETIWLSGYLFDGVTHQPDSVSGVLYVELINPATRQQLVRAQLRAVGSRAPGQLLLPDSLRAGTYQLRGFTNYMRNGSPDYFFTKEITVLSTGAAPAESRLTGGADKIDLQFMPEGGTLVAGLPGRIAFKAINRQGQGCHVSGFVLNNRQDTVIGFVSQRLGMGVFAFQPEAGQTYSAFLNQPNGVALPVAFPAVQPVGAVITVDNVSGKDNIRVYVSHNRPLPAGNESAQLTLVAQTRGQVVQVARTPLSKKNVMVQLPRKQFPEGIAQVTLFDETNTPVCERLLFVDHNNRLTITVSPVVAAVKPRGKIDLDLTVTGADGRPVATALSLAVTDGKLVPPDTSAATLVSGLLLTSDLTGVVEQPGYYFDPRQAARRTDLDVLMMTHGWRRFTWKQVLTDSLQAPRYPLETGLSLTGRVVRANQKTAGKVRLTFMLTQADSSRTMLAGESDENGVFGAYGLDFADSATVLVQAVRGKTDRSVAISLDQLVRLPVVVTTIPFNPVAFDRQEYDEFVRRTQEYLAIERQIRNNRDILLKEITVKARRTVERDTRKIYSNADATVKFDLQNTAGALTVLDVIRGRVAGVQVTGNGFNTSVQIRGASSFTGANEPLFVLDGMPTSKETVFSIPVSDVDYVDVLKGASAAIYGSQGAGGVIIVMTKRGAPDHDFSKDPAAGSLVATVPGYTTVREFYVPRYDQLPAGGRPDYRATLYWSPLIRTDANGKARVSFFASDARTRLHIVAEGVGANGQPGTGTGQAVVE